jgi:hypothetical protein
VDRDEVARRAATEDWDAQRLQYWAALRKAK